MSTRRKTNTVIIGGIPTGGDFPVRIQSMTNTLTSDIDATFEQCLRLIDAGAEFVRITVPSVADVDNFREIKNRLRSKGINTPLIADVHFNTEIALKVAEIADKVRINPGNFGITGKFRKAVFTDEEYTAEYDKQKEVFISLLNICRRYNTAIRIGINHGSLSDRIVSRYGDTAEGMVESALEFLRICRDENFSQIIISMKASNARIMIYATRLLVEKMMQENMFFPLHLGVTEAGEGEDGRIKSAVGIGTLLNEGIGDTIRVSLTEDPESEIPVASRIIEFSNQIIKRKTDLIITDLLKNPFNYNRRSNSAVGNIGGNNVPIVIADLDNNTAKANSEKTLIEEWQDKTLPDFFFISEWNPHVLMYKKGLILPFSLWRNYLNYKNVYPLYKPKEIKEIDHLPSEINFVEITAEDFSEDVLDMIKSNNNIVLIFSALSDNIYNETLKFFSLLSQKHINIPVILKGIINDWQKETYQIKASVQLGSFFIDGLADGIWLAGSEDGNTPEKCLSAYAILQAARARMSRTEYIACPSCGRTHFNLMEILAKIKARTSHLKGLKIGVMGCIVNGPGEMADADYGYVGSGVGKITLYKGKEIIKRNIPEESALDEMINLMKQYGDWREPE